MPQKRFLFGATESDLSSFGDFSELANNVQSDEFPITDELESEDLLRGARDAYYADPNAESDSDTESESDLNPEHVFEEEFLYFRYVAGTVAESVELTDEGQDDEIIVKSRDTMDFVLFPDGRFIYQSAQPTPYEAIRLVICFTTGNENPDFSISDQGTVTPEILRSFYRGEFYNNMDHSVNEIKIGPATDESESADSDDPEPSLVSDILRVSEEVTFNGWEESDLANSSVISEFASQGGLRAVNSKPDSGNSRVLSDNGWLKFSYPDSLGPEPRSKLVCSRCVPILNATTST